MNLNTIKEVQAKQSYPSVTITLPTYRTSPDNDKDIIRLKNLVSEAVSRLQEEFGKRETSEIVDKINRLADSVDNEHNLDGLVIFASAEYDEMFRLPFRVPERVTIADNFLTRDLVFAMNRSPLYLLVVLSEHGTRLFVGRQDQLNEVHEFGFPFSVENQVAEANPSQDISHVRDQIVTDKMREVGQALLEAEKQLSAPIVVVGVDRNIGQCSKPFGKDRIIFFFFRMKTQVLQHQDFAWLQCLGGRLGYRADTVAGKFHFLTQQGRKVFGHRRQRKFWCRAVLGATEVRPENQR